MHRDRSWAHDGMPHSSTRGRWGVGEAAKAKPSTCDASRPGTDPWDGDMVFLRVEKSHCIWPWACAPESEIGCPLHWRTAKACLASLAQRTLFRSTGDAGPALDSRASARSLPGRGSGLSVEEQWRDWVWQGSAGVRRARRCRDSSGAGHWLLAAFARSRKGRRPGGVRPQAGGGDDQCYQPAWVCDAIASPASWLSWSGFLRPLLGVAREPHPPRVGRGAHPDPAGAAARVTAGRVAPSPCGPAR